MTTVTPTRPLLWGTLLAAPSEPFHVDGDCSYSWHMNPESLESTQRLGNQNGNGLTKGVASTPAPAPPASASCVFCLFPPYSPSCWLHKFDVGGVRTHAPGENRA